MIDSDPEYNTIRDERYRQFEALWSKDPEWIEGRKKEWQLLSDLDIRNPICETAADQYFIGRYYVYGEPCPVRIRKPFQGISFKSLYRFLFTPFANEQQIQDMLEVTGQDGESIHANLHHSCAVYLSPLDDSEVKVKFLVQSLYNKELFNLKHVNERGRERRVTVKPEAFIDSFELCSTHYLSANEESKLRRFCQTPYLVDYYVLSLSLMANEGKGIGQFLPNLIKRLKEVEGEKFGDSRDLLRDRLVSLLTSEAPPELLQGLW